jgi:hypothetical protein
MRRFTIAAVAVLAIAGSTAVYAQHHRWFGDHMRQMRMNPEDRAAFADAKIAGVHAGLKLSPDQEKLWPPVESAVRDLVKVRTDHANARMKAQDGAKDGAADAQKPDGQQADDPVARLREHAATMAATAAAMTKIADAADPLYKTLDDGQKRRLAVLTHHAGRGGEGGWRHHWMERGEGGPGERDFGMGPMGRMGHMRHMDDDGDAGRL